MRSLRRLAPIDHLQAGDATHVCDVSCDQDQPMLQRRGCDEYVGIADYLTPLLQIRIDGSGAHADRLGQRQYVAVLAQCLESQLLTDSSLDP